MGKPLVKLVQGARSLDLNDQARYWLAQDFTPPETAITPMFAGDAGDVFDRTESNRAFSFTVAITGSSAGQIDGAVRAIKTMLARAGQSEPLYLVYNASDTVPDPLWGQFGAALRYEVAYGAVALADGYMVGVRRATDLNVRIAVTIKPYALGKQQRLASALGGIIEDTFGAVDGLSRGLFIPEAATNKLTNPVFDNATWNSGWTTEANLISSQNTDSRFVLFGRNSARLIGMASVPTNGALYQSINVGNTNTHLLSFYARKPDESAVTASDIRPRYNATVYAAATYTAVGGGWYRVTQAVTGVNASVAVGAVVQTPGVTIYIDGVQIEERAYATPVVHGDLLGCAWTGTAHASTSTRTAAVVKLPSGPTILPDAPFSARVAFKSLPVLGTAEGEILDARDGSHLTALRFYMAAGVTPTVTYGGVTLTGAALAANTTYIYHITYDGATIRLYLNGVSASSASATPTAAGPTLFVGCNYASAVQMQGSLREFSTFDVALSATQVAADYANAAAAVADGGRLESVPWHWTIDGDDVYDNCLDSTRTNWGVIGSVPGTAPADTLFDLTASGVDTTIDLALNPIEQWVNPSKYIYADFSGTVDANSSGGAYKQSTIDTSGLVLLTVLTIQDDLIRFKAIEGRQFTPLMRVYDVGASAVDYRVQPYSATSAYVNSLKTLSASWQIARLTAFEMYDAQSVLIQEGTEENVTISLIPLRSVGSADIRLDYVLLMIGTLVSLSGFAASSPSVKLNGAQGIEYLPASSNRYSLPKVSAIGGRLEVSPNRFNTLVVNLGATITRTLTMNAVKVTPRYEVL